MEFKIISYDLNPTGPFNFGNDPVAIIEHHAAAKVCGPDDINRWHKGRGWICAGYNYFIRKDGTIYALRPENAVGAHTIGFNARSIGVCHEGDFSVETMTDVQRLASIWLDRYLFSKYPKIKTIYQHGEVYPTACAGKNFPEAEVKTGAFAVETPVSPKEPIDTANTLREGDAGVLVRNLQSELSKLGYTCDNDGSFGKETKGCVYRFQQDNKICADGIVGPQTQALINAKIAALGKPTPAPAPVDQRVLGLQKSLNRLKIANLTEDGKYGPATTAAVKIFQTIVGAEVDGDAGSETFACLDYILEKPTCGLPYRTPAPTAYVQWRIGITVDGVFGVKTDAAVKKWQSKNGLSADGHVGPKSWAKLIG